MKEMYEYQVFICSIVALNSNLYKVKHVTRAVTTKHRAQSITPSK